MSHFLVFDLGPGYFQFSPRVQIQFRSTLLGNIFREDDLVFFFNLVYFFNLQNNVELFNLSFGMNE